MRRVRLLLCAAVLSGAIGPLLPGFAGAPVATSTTVLRSLRTGTTSVVPLGGGDLVAGVALTSGTATVAVRWHRPAGWTAWTPAEVDAGALAGSGGDAGVRPGTQPLWRPRGADAVAVRVTGADVVEPRLFVVGERTTRRWVAGRRAHAAPTTTGEERLGTVVSRADWGADESIRKRPTYQARYDAVVVHHTTNANDYSMAEAPALVRAIYAFHVRGRGYDDIGYHLLVDRFGRVYEGRAGGYRTRAIKGSHTGGFNERTLGVSMIGNLDEAAPAEEMVQGVARVASWAADRWRFDPRADVTLTSRGSTRFPSGRRVEVPRVAGHRDLSATACPGRYGYPLLPSWRDRAWRLLAPVITDAVVQGAPGRSPEPVRIRARLTAPARWRVTVTSPYGGYVVTSNEGHGTALTLEWDGRTGGLPAVPGEYTWTATADDGVHGASDPVTGTVAVGAPVAERTGAGTTST